MPAARRRRAALVFAPSVGRVSDPPSRVASLPVASRRAFTLMEVLIALMIVAMAVVVLGASYLNVLNSYEAVGRGMVVNEDFAFARQTVLTEPDRTKLERGGDFESVGGRRVKWTAEIESTTVPDVFRVVFACEIDDPSRTEADKQTQTFHLLRPTWVKDAAERGKLVEQMKTRIAEIQGDIAAKQARR